MFPDDRVSAISIGSVWVSRYLDSSFDDATLWIEICRDKIVCGSNAWVFINLELDSLSDTTVESTKELSNFVKSRWEAWSSWYEPSANTFA